MVMHNDFKQDVLDHIDNTPKDVLAEAGHTRDSLKADTDLIEKLWYHYQKSVSEYDVDPEYAWNDAMYEVLRTRDLNTI